MKPADSSGEAGGTLVQLVRAEHIKLRRTFAGHLWWVVAALGAACSLGLTFAVPESAKAKGADPAMEFVSVSVKLWAALFLPLLAVMRCAAAGQVEFANRGLKHLFALPVPRTRVFVAKAVSAGIALTSASALFFLLTALAGLQRGVLSPDLAQAAWAEGAGRAAAILWAGLALAAMQVAISANVASYAAVVSLGIGLLVLSMAAGPLLGALSIYYPWSIASTVATLPLSATQPLLVWGGGLIALSLAAGAAVFRRRQAL